MYFLELPDRITQTFPREYTLDWSDPDLQIAGRVAIDPTRTGRHRTKAAEVRVTLRNPGDGRQVSADLTIPADTCKTASRALVDLFPAVTTDDLDWI